MAARAGTGIEIDLSLVPQRETGMTAYEMLLSESQERMLIVAHTGREREVVDIFRKWDLDAVVIGRVRDGNRMRVIHNGEIVCDIPVAALTDEAPVYERPMTSQVRRPRSKVQQSRRPKVQSHKVHRNSQRCPAKASRVAQPRFQSNGSIASTITWCAPTRRCCPALMPPWCESKKRDARWRCRWMAMAATALRILAKARN